MTRAELLEHICFTNYTNECSAVDGRYNCQDCKDAINPLLDEYDEQIRAEVIEEVTDELLKLPKIFVDYFDYIAVARITKKLEQLKEQK